MFKCILLALYTMSLYANPPEQYLMEFVRLYPTHRYIRFLLVSPVKLAAICKDSKYSNGIEAKDIIAVSNVTGFKNVVLINSHKWAKMPEKCQRRVIYHELGHTLLGIIEHSEWKLHYENKWDEIMQPSLNCY